MIKVDLEPESLFSKIAKENDISILELNKLLSVVEKNPSIDVIVEEDKETKDLKIVLNGLGPIKNKFGDFWLYDFFINDKWKKYLVIVKAEKIDKETLKPIFSNKDRLILRIDSGCETGQIFGDLTCDCKNQLDLAMETIGKSEGVIIHIPGQDGRGMGLPFKLKTLWLQEELGINTIEAALLLSSDGIIDRRTFSGAICILKFFEIPPECKIIIATNNPKKALVFGENGYVVSKQLPVIVEPTPYTIKHLTAKKDILGHNLKW